jgi:Ca2+-binding EF-hand superfamily protein
VLQRRDEALVQNKVLRALSRRGLSLRELFHLLDMNGDGEIDPSEFVKGVQV